MTSQLKRFVVYLAWSKFANSNGFQLEADFDNHRLFFQGDYRQHQIEVKADLNQALQITTTHFIVRRSLGKDIAPSKENALKQAEVEQLLDRCRPLTDSPILFRTDEDFIAYTYLSRQAPAPAETLDPILDTLIDLSLAHSMMMMMGGSVIPMLVTAVKHDKRRKALASRLLKDIVIRGPKMSPAELERMLCLDCITRFGRQQIRVSPLIVITYYACRSCGRGHRAEEVDQVVVVLDQTLHQVSSLLQRDQNKRLYVNWTAQAELFDFDAVHIWQADDELVERFAVQVGNDTDEFRRRRPAKIDCTISANGHLSENSRRILRHTFGQIKESHH